jgi:surface antigen
MNVRTPASGNAPRDTFKRCGALSGAKWSLVQQLPLIFFTLVMLAAYPSAAQSDGTSTADVIVSGSSLPDRGRELVRVVVGTSSHAICRAWVTFRGKSQNLGEVQSSQIGGVRWQGEVAPGTPGGSWEARAQCDAPSTNQVSSNGAAYFPVGPGPRGASGLSLLVASSVRGIPYSHKVAKGANGEAGDTPDPLMQALNEDPYEQGQCTWWAWAKRPDLPLFVGKKPGTGAEARYWFQDAIKDHLAVGNRPRARAIAVFLPGQGPIGGQAGASGHVAYVIAVHSSKMLISEANFRHTPPGHRRWLKWAGLKFIYGRTSLPPSSMAPPHPSPLPVPSASASVGFSVFHYFVYQTCANGQCGVAVRTGPSLEYPQVGQPLPDGAEVGIVCQLAGQAVSGANRSASYVWDQLTSGYFIPDFYVDTPGTSPPYSPPIPICGQGGTPGGPVAAPGPPVAPETYSEQEGHNGVNTFTDPFTATGLGPTIAPARVIQVSCKVYAPQIQSVNPDGYWYRVASPPWNSAYYSPANTFMNGDPWEGPYTHNTDFAVPDC